MANINIVEDYYQSKIQQCLNLVKIDLTEFYIEVFHDNLAEFILESIKRPMAINGTFSPPLIDRGFLEEGSDAYKTDLFSILKTAPNHFKNPSDTIKYLDNSLIENVFHRWKQDQDDLNSSLERVVRKLDFSGTVKVIEFLKLPYKNQLRDACNLDNPEYQKFVEIAKHNRNTRNVYLGHFGSDKRIEQSQVIQILKKMKELLSFIRFDDSSEDNYRDRFENTIKHIDETLYRISLPPIPFSVLSEQIPDFDPKIIKDVRPENTDIEKKYFYFLKEDEILHLYQLIAGEKTTSEQLQKYEGIKEKLTATTDGGEQVVDVLIDFIRQISDKDIPSSAPTSSQNSRSVQNPVRVPLREMQKYKGGHLTDKQESELFQNALLFADTSVWTKKPACDYLAYTLSPKLKKHGVHIIADWATRTDLFKIEQEGNDSNQRKNAQYGRNVMRFLHDKDSVIYGSVQENFVSSQDNIMHIASLNPDRRIVVFTQDKEFTDVLAHSGLTNILPVMIINKDLSIRRSAFNMARTFASEYYITEEDGLTEELERNPTNEPISEVKAKQSSASNTVRTAESIPSPKHKLSKKSYKKYSLKPETGVKITIDKIPSEGSRLYTDINKSSDIQLRKQIGVGGEGIVYTTDRSGTVAKIYHKETLTINRRDKIFEMVDAAVHIHELCWPTHVLYTEDGTFVGYTMPALPEHYQSLNESVLQLNKESVRQNLLPDWNRLSLVQLCKVLCSVFKNMHEYGIMMGDVNANNIMVDIRHANTIDVKFVDCDSYQFRGYPCPVGMKVYTSPEIYKRLGTDNPHFGDFLRTEDDELYAIASLLFRILMLNASAFEGKGSLNIDEAIRNYNFAYRTETNRGENTPDGPNRMIWNNTLKQVRENFETVFTGKGSVSLNRWLSAFETYENLIKEDKYTSELTPNRYYVPEGVNDMVDIICDSCGEASNMPKTTFERNKRIHMPPLCPRCNMRLRSLEYTEITPDNDRIYPRNYVCEICGQQKVAENYYEAYMRTNEIIGFEPICPSCRNEKYQFNCDACGNDFTVTPANFAKLKKSGKTPSLCKSCRTTEILSCDKCGKEFRTIRAQRIRNEQNHYRNLCEDCRKSIWRY